MDRILLVEDSKFFEIAVTRSFRRSDGFEIVVAKTFAEATRLLATAADRFSVALVDLSLPDTTDVETVDLTTSHGLPTVVFSSRFDPQLQTRLYAKGIVDYVLKDSPASLGYLRELVLRLRANRGIGALLVENPAAPLDAVAEQLRRLQLDVERVGSHRQALAELATDSPYRLLVLDHDLPDTEAIDLIKQLRHRRGPEKIAIVTMAETVDQTTMVRLLKSGSNDVLSKSCPPEEFLLRVGQNLDTIDRMLKLTAAANRDSMTGLYNRRYLFETGSRLYAECRRQKRPITVALLDIDCFKLVNDRYGHQAGDLAIKNLAEDLSHHSGDEVMAVRLGGDEFCLLLPGAAPAEARACCRRIYDRFRRRRHFFAGRNVEITLSIGLSDGTESDLDEAIRIADQRMYSAKISGRDQIASEAAPGLTGTMGQAETVLLDV